MKIEANPSPEQLKWLVIAALLVGGLGHEQIMVMVGL